MGERRYVPVYAFVINYQLAPAPADTDAIARAENICITSHLYMCDHDMLHLGRHFYFACKTPCVCVGVRG